MDNDGSIDRRLTPSGRSRDLPRHAEGNCWKGSSTLKVCAYLLIPSGKVLTDIPKSVPPLHASKSHRVGKSNHSIGCLGSGNS